MNGVQMECCCYGPLAIQHAIPLASIRGALPQTSEIGVQTRSKTDHFGVWDSGFVPDFGGSGSQIGHF